LNIERGLVEGDASRETEWVGYAGMAVVAHSAAPSEAAASVALLHHDGVAAPDTEARPPVTPPIRADSRGSDHSRTAAVGIELVRQLVSVEPTLRPGQPVRRP
jgi:hypothetical protein